MREREREIVGSDCGSGEEIERIDTHISVRRIVFGLFLGRPFGRSCGGGLGLAG